MVNLARARLSQLPCILTPHCRRWASRTVGDADDRATQDRVTDDVHCWQWCHGRWASLTVGPPTMELPTLGPRTMRVDDDGFAYEGIAVDAHRTWPHCWRLHRWRPHCQRCPSSATPLPTMHIVCDPIIRGPIIRVTHYPQRPSSKMGSQDAGKFLGEVRPRRFGN